MGEKGKSDEKAKAEEITIAINKLNLHCKECARAIEKPLSQALEPQAGVHKVDSDVDSGKVTVKGLSDAMKLHELNMLISISPKPKEKEKEEKSEKKEVVPKTTVIKVHLHCENCEHDLKMKLLKLKGTIHCTHPPQWFSAEDPNACSIV